jgi:hypothetical protein
MWIDKVIENANHNMGRLFFKVFGIDRSKLDFSFFGPSNGPIGTYANVYNRFFRTVLLGALNYFFPDVPITIQKIFHDTEGNLQHHTYFDWHCIRKIGERDNRITFTCRRVKFVNSNHMVESQHPKASHVIQFTDLIVGSVTYCIHETNLQNKGQFKVSEKILPLVNNILTKPYDQNNSLGYYKKYDICHFPKEHLRFLNEDRIPGEFFRLRCDNFLNRVTGQQLLDFS